MDSAEEFERAIDNLINLAMQELHAFTERLDYSKPYECKQATLVYVKQLANKYEQASQEVAMLEYKAMRGGVDDGFKVKPYQGLTDDDFMSSIEYYCKYLFGEVEQDEQV